MENVKYPFHLYANWNPLYNQCKIPLTYKGEIFDHYKKLIKKIEGHENTKIENIYINDVISNLTPDYKKDSYAFCIEGFKDTPLSNIFFNNVQINAKIVWLYKIHQKY